MTSRLKEINFSSNFVAKSILIKYSVVQISSESRWTAQTKRIFHNLQQTLKRSVYFLYPTSWRVIPCGYNIWLEENYPKACTNLDKHKSLYYIIYTLNYVTVYSKRWNYKMKYIVVIHFTKFNKTYVKFFKSGPLRKDAWGPTGWILFGEM